MAEIKNHERNLALLLGYILVAGLFFNLGRYAGLSNPPQIRIEEPALNTSQLNDTLKLLQTQTAKTETGEVAGAATELNCEGKIKGNISASGKIYHLPGGAFYKRTNPELCFGTEAEAQTAGFRKSQR